MNMGTVAWNLTKMIDLVIRISRKNFKTSCYKYVQGLKDGYNERTYGEAHQKKWKQEKELNGNFRTEKP